MNVNAFQMKATIEKHFHVWRFKKIVIRKERMYFYVELHYCCMNELSGFRKTTSGLKVN